MQDTVFYIMFVFGGVAFLMLSARLALIKKQLEDAQKELDWLRKRFS